MKFSLDKKKLFPHLICIILIVLAQVIYLSPQLEGKKIAGGDAVSSTAWSKQNQDYAQQTGETAFWNPSMFSGMPWGLLTAGYQYNLLREVNDIAHLYISYPMGLFIKSALVAYLAGVLLGFGPWISLLVALLLTFNVNYTVLIEAGHQSKLDVITNFSLIIASIIIGFRGRIWLAMGILGAAISLSFLRNHPQMVYYLMLLLIVFWLVFLIFELLEKKKVVSFLKITALLFLASILGLGSNMSQVYSSKEFADYTMRGKSILTNDKIPETAAKEGLSWDYAMSWSNELKDLYSLIIPAAVGGGSGEEVSKSTATGKLLVQNKAKVDKQGNVQAPMYWGGLGITSGPYYIGAICFFLFVLGGFIVDRRLYIAFLSSIILLFLLSMGKNFEVLNRFLFDYAPFFDKFRTPNSILNIVPSFFILVAGFSLVSLYNFKDKSSLSKPVLYSLGIAAFLPTVFLFFGGQLFDFQSPGDARYPKEVISIFIETRKEIQRADSLRTLSFLIASFSVIWIYVKGYLKDFKIIVFVLLTIGLFDLIQVNRRYLDADNFASKRSYKNILAPRNVDKQIFKLEPNGRGYYRVFDQSINTFNSANTSYHHNTIGGYHAAKLRRYQDLIENQIAKGNQEVLNMLNTKYFIDKSQKLSVNGAANGNAWLVNEIIEVNTPNEEINKLSGFNSKTQAVVNVNEFDKSIFDDIGDGDGSIKLTSYAPPKLVYKCEGISSSQVAVFSEIWFDKGWRATVDGIEVPIFRANFALRGIEIPAGAKEVVFEMKPDLRYSWVSVACSIVILSLLGFVGFQYWKTKRA